MAIASFLKILPPSFSLCSSGWAVTLIQLRLRLSQSPIARALTGTAVNCTTRTSQAKTLGTSRAGMVQYAQNEKSQYRKSRYQPLRTIVILSGLTTQHSIQRDASEESPCRNETLR